MNNNGQPRLVKFYTPLPIAAQQELVKQVYAILLQRSVKQCNFLTPPQLLLETREGAEDAVRVIYRQYATLNFVFIVDRQESELGILDLIQVFVEALDRCFGNVCELDLVFGWEVLETVLEEIVQGGLVLETNVAKIVAAVDDANRQGNLGNEAALTAASRALSQATSVFRSYVAR